MAATKSPSPLRTAALGALLPGTLGALTSAGCTSERCIGARCPTAGLDPTCEGAEAQNEVTGRAGGVTAGTGAGTGRTGGSGGSTGAGTGGKGGSGGSTGGAGGSVSGSGRFTPCSPDATCDTAHGFACVAGECRHPCRSHFDCVGVGLCEVLAPQLGCWNRR